jgi:nucleoid-associated protein YgaU
MKKLRAGVSILLAFLVLMSFAGCAKPPTTEMANARQEFQNATDSGAEQYAQMEYANAQAALNQAEELMSQGKYKQAREKAKEALSLARAAQVAAVNNQNTANRSAKEMYDMALNAVNSANNAGAYTYAEAQMRDAQLTLDEAKRAYEAGEYGTAKQLAESALVKAQKAEALALQARRDRESQVTQQATQGMLDSGATPRDLTEHVVIKGETLWWIAEYKQVYDDPFQWPLIYKANRSQIKDPDLIYPDQVFKIARTPEIDDAMIAEAIKFAKNRGAWSLYDGK